MKKTKKRLLIAICILLLVSLFFTFHFVTAVQNPFDEMYYSAWQVKNSFWGKPFLKYTETTYWGQPGNRSGRDYPSIAYEPSNLQKNEYVFIVYSKETVFRYKPYTHLSGTLTISIRYYTNKKQLIFEPLEYVSKNTSDPPTLEAYLTQNDISKEDIENLQQRLLYDIVLTNWFNANQGVSKYSFEDLGSFKIINNTFEDS